MGAEIERILELVKSFISNSEASRENLSGELERLRKHTTYFSDRIDKISTEVEEVEGLKKLSQMEQEQFISLTKVAENLRYKINNIQDNFHNESQMTSKKVEHVEEIVLNTQHKVFHRNKNRNIYQSCLKRLLCVEMIVEAFLTEKYNRVQF